MNREDENVIVEAMEQLRINFAERKCAPFLTLFFT